jgi:hypothetical protein
MGDAEQPSEGEIIAMALRKVFLPQLQDPKFQNPDGFDYIGVAKRLESGNYTDDDLNTVYQSLGIRLSYLMFDLEATRREKRYLRHMLEGRRNSGSGD